MFQPDVFVLASTFRVRRRRVARVRTLFRRRALLRRARERDVVAAGRVAVVSAAGRAAVVVAEDARKHGVAKQRSQLPLHISC